jgi:HK97 family phage portal protein
VIVLNDGLEFKESSNTSVEMQMNENKETNSKDVCKVFLIPPSIINGNASEEDKKQYYQGCIMPILARFATALNRAMLTEDEKQSMFFGFDDTELTKGDIEKRFAAYKTALDAGFMQVDEIRRNEKLQAFGLDFIKLGLQDVIYFPEEHKIYTPNTNKMSEMGAEAEVAPVQPLEGGEESED